MLVSIFVGLPLFTGGVKLFLQKIVLSWIGKVNRCLGVHKTNDMFILLGKKVSFSFLAVALLKPHLLAAARCTSARFGVT